MNETCFLSSISVLFHQLFLSLLWCPGEESGVFVEWKQEVLNHASFKSLMLTWRKWCLDGSELFITVLSSQSELLRFSILEQRKSQKHSVLVTDTVAAVCSLCSCVGCLGFLKWHVSPFVTALQIAFQMLHKHLCTWPGRHQSHRADVTESERQIPAGPKLSGKGGILGVFAVASVRFILMHHELSGIYLSVSSDRL